MSTHGTKTPIQQAVLRRTASRRGRVLQLQLIKMSRSLHAQGHALKALAQQSQGERKTSRLSGMCRAGGLSARHAAKLGCWGLVLLV